MKTCRVLGLLWACLLATSVLTPAASAAVGSVNKRQVRPWSMQFENGFAPLAAAEALADARHFSVIAAHDRTYRPHVTAMRAANPKVKLFVYLNATYTWEADLPEHWYAHDALGKRIRARLWPKTYLLNPSSPGAIAYTQRRAARALATSGYHGVFLDVLGAASVTPAYVTSLPINPATGLVWTEAEWLRATTTLAARVGPYVGSAPVFGNGLGNGTRYFDPAAPAEQILDSGIAGGMAEYWLRGPWQPLVWYPDEAAWKQSVDMLVEAGRRGVSVMTVTKAWGAGTRAERKAWYQFALASYLLGNDGRSYFYFSARKGDARAKRRWDRLRLGRPLSRYRKVAGVYQRSFRLGRVLVNPTGETHVVALGRAYHRLSGTRVRVVTLRPHRAAILRLRRT